MPSVDDRIVSMQFNNQAFESKIAATLGSLDKLKSSLDFASSKRGLEDLTAAGHNFSLSGIGDAVEGISSKFSAMGVVAFSVINSIVTSAISAGVSIVKSLSLDQVISGFQEYETNMNSIQTVMANTKSDGTTLNDVNKALDTLNTYSDKTIYNFSQMAKNIGTFTAAGVNLDTSVTSIKGIANLAAISGSNADQASTAMYQLSQAIASGSVKLMDWNSIVNAGMGGEVFQKALFETGKAMHTIKDVPMGQTFEEWTAAGNTFRGSLESGWITSEVLTNTLSGFTGDLTDAQLLSMGYNAEQVKTIQELGKTGTDAATKVKTLTQLISTIKESVGSGWSASFRIIFGDFQEAQDLFTGVSTALGSIVGASSDARNSLLQGWKDLGGRSVLIDALKTGFEGLGKTLTVIKDAFHEVFPPATAQSLYNLTVQFHDFMDNLNISETTLVDVKRIFVGLFSAISIGWDLVKGVAGFFKELFQNFAGVNIESGGLVGFLARLGDKIVALKQLLDESNGIADFFKFLAREVEHFLGNLHLTSLQGVIDGLVAFKNLLGDIFGGINFSGFDKIKSFFDNIFGGFDPKVPKAMEGGLARLGSRLSWLWDQIKKVGDVFGWFWDKLVTVKDAVVHIVDTIWNTVKNIGPNILSAIRSEDFSKVMEAVQTGLAGGFLGVLAGFKKNGLGINLDLTGGALTNFAETTKNLGGTFTGITKSLDALTGSLKTMQTGVKAEALLKIAIAVGLLTASIVVLASIDSGALGKSMGTLAIGFGQLIGAMAALNQISSGPKAAASLALLAAGMILMAGAVLVLSVAVKNLAGLDVEALGKGIGAITLLLGVLTAAVVPLSNNSSGMVKAGIGILAIAVALNILALAVKSFAEMEWEAMAQGLTGVSVGLGVIVAAMNLLPDDMVSKGAGLLAVSVALNIMALAVKSFAEMKWADMAKGMAGVAASILIVAGAMNLMPKNLALQGAGLVLIGVGLNIMAKAIKTLGGMKWADMAKGLAGIAATLLILAVAAQVMQSSIGGAAAIAIMSISLGKLAEGLLKFAAISWGDLLHGLVALGATLAVLGIAGLLIQPVIPALLGLGAALILLGGGFALFGVGAELVAGAFAILAKAGTEGVAVLLLAIDGLIARLPEFIASFGDGIIQLAQKVLDALPGIIANLDEVIAALLQLVIDNIPKMAEVFTTLIGAALQVIRDKFPDFVETGFTLLMQLLQGISDHIEEVTNTVIDIILKFLDAITNRLPDIIAKGTDLLVAFLNGIADNIGKVIDQAADVIVKFIQGISDNMGKIITAAADLIIAFVKSIGDEILRVVAAGTLVIVKIIEGIGDAMTQITTAAADTIVKFVDGLDDNILKVVNAGWDFIINLINGISDSIDAHMGELRDAGIRLAGAVIDGMTFGLAGKAKDVIGGALGVGGGIVSSIGGFLGIGSPSKTFIWMAEMMAEGFVVGFDKDTRAVNSALDFTGRITDTMKNSLAKIPSILDGMEVFTPTITPVLDLTSVEKSAGQLGNILGTRAPLSVDLSYSQAALDAVISSSKETIQDPIVSQPVREIKFEQNNYSPESLSTTDLYRQTRNQIAMAKEELAVL